MTIAVDALDQEIRTRFSKRTGSLDRFLGEWIKLDDSQQKLFNAKGPNGETFLQYVISRADIDMSVAIAMMCEEFADTTAAEKVMAFMQQVDNKGNDIWHYLATLLTNEESEGGLQIAKILIQLELDYCRKNNDDETALGKLLLPEVKWKSINSMNAARTLTLEELEKALPDAILANEPMRQEVLVQIFESDIRNNQGVLTSSILHQGLHSSAEKALRDKTMRLFFEYLGGQRRETVFMRACEADIQKLFDGCVDLMTKVVEEETKETAARDINLARAEQQVAYYRRLSIKNRAFQNALSKAVMGNRPKYVSALCSILKNENLVAVSKDTRGVTQKRDVTVDEKSPAPQNPILSLLLQQDAKGNTVFHTAVMLSRTECVRRLFNGLSLMDSFMIVTRIPNRYGLMVSDLLNIKATMTKLAPEVKSGKLTEADANQIVQMVKMMQMDQREFLTDLINRAKETFERTGGLADAKPTFDLKRVPTVALQIREMMQRKVAAGGAGGAPQPAMAR